jgi:hypothetical protein
VAVAAAIRVGEVVDIQEAEAVDIPAGDLRAAASRVDRGVTMKLGLSPRTTSTS